MRFLIDNNLPPRLAELLKSFGHFGVHLREIGLAAAYDVEVAEYAVRNELILLTADNDFPQMLALGGASKPSVVLLSGDYPSEPEKLAILIGNQLDMLASDLLDGAIVVITPQRTRIRKIPI